MSPNPSILMLMEDYRGSYSRAIEADAALGRLSYDALSTEMYGRGIFYGDAYLDAFRKAGLRAEQVVPLCQPLQHRWAKDNGVRVPSAFMDERPWRWPWTRRGLPTPGVAAMRRILDEQIRRFQPDVLWVFSGVPVQPHDLARWRPHVGKIVLWWSCALVDDFPYGGFDLVLSGIPHLVDHFTGLGIPARYMAHAFDDRILEKVSPQPERVPRIAFVGNLSVDHVDRIAFLDRLSRHVDVDFFGLGAEHLGAESPLRARAMGPVWGLDMYRTYGTYAVVVHRNIDMATSAPSAKRMFEATGMAAAVLTEASEDMDRLFDPKREVSTYRDLDEAVRNARALLGNPRLAAEIGLAGQWRTLTQHTYARRVQEFLEALQAEPTGRQTGETP